MTVRRSLAGALAGLISLAAVSAGTGTAAEVGIERPVDDGVSGVITDRPALARDVVSAQPPISTRAIGPARTVADRRHDAERLASRLSLEYAGAVPATQIRTLVHCVVHDLRSSGSPRGWLLTTAEAVCRRQLTDLLAAHRPAAA